MVIGIGIGSALLFIFVVAIAIILRRRKNTKSGKKAKFAAAKNPKKVDKSMGLIGEKYKIQIINLDLQNAEVFEININDNTGEVQEVPLGQAEIKTVL